MNVGPTAISLFIRRFIPKVSRTFALTIDFLPRGLKKTVHASYLLCRVADTLEDTPDLDPFERKQRLIRLSRILNRAAGGAGIDRKELALLYNSIDPESGDDHRLLLESSRLFDIVESLPESHRSIIMKWAAEMAKGMAEYTGIVPVEGEEIAALRDADDWDRYCYYVAGTVGHMLTELFVEQYELNGELSGALRLLSSSFGLGLQKVNVIKDVPDDRQRRVCFLPADMMAKYGLTPSTLGSGREDSVAGFVRELSLSALGHLDDAIEYSTLFPRRLKGVRMFLVVPVLLAVETLNLINLQPAGSMSGPPVKLRRRDVARLVGAATARVSSNEDIRKYYRRLRAKIN